ncbi:Fe-S protein assembly chaperone HscA [Myxococcus sp. CA051A]|uniref:Chaperone protein HscA homolog n=1 Tax=Myxococcus llanfairpwllgwyngyllgogerychwyrndrobwllllantysiliogogogochensis TaxID=2590453 RepID=A0A540WYL7_9BACT|nr:Fe-S protein assembly chaperone HscA [Myxococcus llanfairpwllgwyngyllgogerychwyrndrobwllllantysiliogogogochensis]NTX15663.1 Fe-S protein assembly chaperone HscA [Myxococcus sp. CA056]NTX59938.1 Fe-S protein assembly chaperone HscA [Myxococcus sp. CA051A]TQF14073.1 Fe-S protein assembly chaperone HscA [Myxococcus llanfairpwllgwyngyllgogerychwyrndrobwllllantysiliogogogochensis]
MSKNGYLQIHDPLKPKGQAVGIDLGTTHSLVAAVAQGKPRCVPVDEGDSLLLPSVVHYGKDGGVVTGARARALAGEHPTDTISSVKRFMGRGPDDAETRKLGHYKFAPGANVVRFDVAGGNPVTPIEVSGEILRALKRRAEAHFSMKVEQAVITVPAYFDDAQRQATKDAGRLAGLEVLRLLNEPTAAALAYGLDKGSQGTFAVYDLGGGTFDISILKLVDGVFEVKSTGGDSALGGDDFDRAIASQVFQALGITEPSPSLVAQTLAASRKAKEALTDAPEATVTVGGQSHTVKRADFDAWIQPLVNKTGLVCRRALKDAGVVAGELDGVILVGGSTRVPAVRRFVAEMFGREPLGDIDPDQVVALGAAVQADLLTNEDRQDEVLLLDVIPLSLGLETMGGITEKLIQRNSTIPTAAAQVFTTFKDGQTGLDVHVVQGERELVEDNRSLARFTLSGIPPLAAGMARVEVRFQVDADGILSVSAKEQSTGAAQSITVTPSHGLTEDEIERMLLDSIEYAEDDIQARQLREQRVDAERVLAEADRQLREHGALVQGDERAAIDAALAKVRETAQGNDYLKLKEAVHALDETCRPFIERVMNQAITQVVAGQSVEDY